jgi:hypothetical protein
VRLSQGMMLSGCSGLRVLRSVWFGSREVVSVATVARGFFSFCLAGLGEFKIAIRGMCMCTYMCLQCVVVNNVAGH